MCRCFIDYALGFQTPLKLRKPNKSNKNVKEQLARDLVLKIIRSVDFEFDMSKNRPIGKRIEGMK